jgi:hypothetical protein
VLVDSIHSLCEYKHGHRLRGGIIGFFGGIILGTALGAAFTPSSDGFEQLGGATIGLLIGAVTGTGIGIAAGSGKKFDLDLSKYDHGKRIIILKSLLSER